MTITNHKRLVYVWTTISANSPKRPGDSVLVDRDEWAGARRGTLIRFGAYHTSIYGNYSHCVVALKLTSQEIDELDPDEIESLDLHPEGTNP